MLFASFDFLLFFLPVLAMAWLLQRHPRLRLIVLIGASYFFYMSSGRPVGDQLPTPWYYAGLLFLSTLVDFHCGNKIEHYRIELAHTEASLASRAKRLRNSYLIISLTTNLGLLSYFKYTNFLCEAFADIANSLGASWAAPHFEILIPIGISFYTFQTLSYTIDIWRGKLKPEPSLAKFAMYVAFFPQLVAGPIVRASEFLPQLARPLRLRPGQVEKNLFRIWKGLVKKVVLGDYIAASFIDLVFSSPTDYTSLEILFALYGFSLQMYADFSGYSDIAIGVAGLLGYQLPENFDRPHQARNIGEFWRRWHMTLSTWLRDYLFFPLGGSRGSALRTYFNLWLTMFLVGMWHGASWNFVIYSNLHGMAMVFNRWNRMRKTAHDPKRFYQTLAWILPALGLLAWIVGRNLLNLSQTSTGLFAILGIGVALLVTFLPESSGRFNVAIHIALTFHFTVLSRLFFRADNLDLSGQLVQRLIEWDFLGFRQGFFRINDLQALAKGSLEALGPIGLMISAFAEYGTLWVLLFGIIYHFCPKRWVDESLRRLFCQLPGPVIGLLFATTALMIMKLLDGPRANIYFVF